jgi:flavin-dependent thymidylate synthase
MKKDKAELIDQITPETISAAYARISRDSRSVDELREIAVSHVDKARKSNNNIIFDMGHSSIAEHSIFNFDIIGISRLAIEELEHFRLASYTEKSQRYIKLDNDYNIPNEITSEADVEKFKDIINLQNNFYHEIYIKLKDFLFQQNLSENDTNKNLFDGFAKEDSRYISSLATKGQLGMTLNARTLELMIKRFFNAKTLEVKELGKTLYDKAINVVPSLIRYVDEYCNKKFDFDNFYENMSYEQASNYSTEEVKLLDFNKDADDLVLASILFANKSNSSKNFDFETIFKYIKSLKFSKKESIIKDVFKNMKFYDAPQREFEYLDFMFELKISGACFGQLKRHRMMTMTKQNYDIELGIKIPENIEKIGYKNKFLQIIEKTNEIYLQFKKKYGINVAEYVLTNSHMRKILIKINARSLYNMSRIREDKHAQWDIRELCSKILQETKKVAPLTMILACGKDKFLEIYNKLYDL